MMCERHTSQPTVRMEPLRHRHRRQLDQRRMEDWHSDPTGPESRWKVKVRVGSSARGCPWWADPSAVQPLGAPGVRARSSHLCPLSGTPFAPAVPCPSLSSPQAHLTQPSSRVSPDRARSQQSHAPLNSSAIIMSILHWAMNHTLPCDISSIPC